MIMSGHRFTKMNKKKPVKPSTHASNQQRTLFQTWGARISSCPAVSSQTSETDKNAEVYQPSPEGNTNTIDSEEEDELLMQALEQTTNLSREIGTTSFELQDDATEIDLSSIPDLPGFDKSAGLKWIYPTNYPVRVYQFDIVKSALFQNTLVALPTGLGKTFIAAVVMFNFYRWYPLGKIVFMAPTKPLVTQQIEACYNIMGIPQLDIAEMTGKMLPVARQKSWKEKRVMFLTPQVLINDLSRGTCQADKIKCLVIDEAHKSLGNYAYCQVVQELVKITRDFRVLALSATPGSNLAMVQDVITNLLISHIELRTDESSEIKMYSFERKVEKIVVPLGEELKSVEAQYVELLESVVNRLLKQKVLYRQNIKSLSKFIILKCRDEFRQNPPHFLQHAQLGVIEGDFALAISLYHGYELLQLHGLRSFYQYLQSLVNREKGYGRTRSELMKNVNFVNIYDYLTNKFGEKPSITFSQQTTQEKTAQYVIGHPKLEKLQEIVLEHFRKFQKEDGSSDTRVMIFSQYRNSVSDITEMLKRQQPLVKVISFMGQAIKKETKGFTQKEQLRVMKLFREGNYNTLVSTCVGEEGLDIGDVDLIICFDASKSPIRLVQRMGRTGRKRDGRIVMLVTEGKEDMIYKRSQYNKNSITKALLNGTKSLHYYQHSPRMLPEGLMPQCHKMYITIKKKFETLDQAKALKKKEKKTKIAKGKIKKIPDLFSDENSTDGRLTPISNSNSSVQSSEFQPGLDIGDNVRSSSPPTYELLSDDELPDLSPQKKISRPKKAIRDTNRKEKPNSKTTKKKSTQREKQKIKKGSKKKEELPLIIIPDDDSNSDFVEELSEPACDILKDNGTIRTLFKSQAMSLKQKALNMSSSANSTESQKSYLSKSNPIHNCLVPVAPPLENISELLDLLEAQGTEGNSLNLAYVVDKWDKEFNATFNRTDILSNSEGEKLPANIRTDFSAAMASSSVAQNKNNNNNKQFFHLTPERMDTVGNDKDGSKSPDLVESAVTSLQRNCQVSDISSPDLSDVNNLSHHKRKLSVETVGSLKLSKLHESKSSAEEKNQSDPFGDDYQGTAKCLKSKSFTEPDNDDSKLVTSYGDLFADFSQSFDHAAEIEDNSHLLPERTENGHPGPQKQNPVHENSRFSDILFNEAILHEDDHPVFDLTTDMFSEDESADDTGQKYDAVKAPATNLKCISTTSSETTSYRTHDLAPSPVALEKNCNSSKLSSLIVSFVNTKFQTSDANGDMCKNDDDDLPLFDLGLDFDALPPTPDHKNSCSSRTSQSNQECSTPILLQNIALSTSEYGSRGEKSSAVKDMHLSSSSDEELGGFRCVLPTLNVIEHLQQSTPSSKKKSTPVAADLFSARFSADEVTSPLHENKDESSPSLCASQGFDLKFDELLDDEQLDGWDVAVQPKDEETERSPVNQEIATEMDKCESSDDSFLVKKNRKRRVVLKSPSPLHQSSHRSFTNGNETMDDEGEDSFCVRKKKKSSVLTSPLISSQSEGEDGVRKKGQDNYNGNHKTLGKKKESHSQFKKISFLVEDNSQEDFVKADENRCKWPSNNKAMPGNKNSKLQRKSRHLVKQCDQLDGRQFLDEEAELSGSDDGHSDEEVEEAGHYEQSFINDLSQIDQTQNVVDMKAVYLQSVVSPIAKHRDYKMNYLHVSDVYSCPPESDDDYEHDSFCVESAESSLTENTFVEKSSFEKETLKEKKKTNIEKKNKTRRVIRPESSSEEEEIFKDPQSETILDCNKAPAGLVLNAKRNEQISKLDSHSVVASESKDCQESGPLVIFADSREITGAQDIISDLRIQHKLNVVVTKLEACDYIVSLRTAVERKHMSDFVNGANNKKLVKRLQDMCDYFERPCLIVEKNPQKGSDKKNIPRAILQTKYLETLLSQLSLSPVRLLFSDSKIETCGLLASLCFQENVKGMAICRNQTLSDTEQQKMKFFLSLPKVNHALALNLCKNYKNIQEFLQSSVSLIVSRSKMSSERAVCVYKFVRQQYR